MFILDSLLYYLIVGVVGVGGVGVGLIGGLISISSLLEGGDFLTPVNTSLLIFLLIVPLLNALLDFISLTISRYFSRQIANGEPIGWIVIHLILDFILAILFLFALASVLYFSITLFNTLVNASLHIPISTMLTNTINNPFNLENAWVTFMLLSTLLPTLLHFLLALVSLSLYITKTSNWYVNLIENNQETTSQKMKVATLLSIPTGLLAMLLFYLCYASIYIPLVKFAL